MANILNPRTMSVLALSALGGLSVASAQDDAPYMASCIVQLTDGENVEAADGVLHINSGECEDAETTPMATNVMTNSVVTNVATNTVQAMGAPAATLIGSSVQGVSTMATAPAMMPMVSVPSTIVRPAVGVSATSTAQSVPSFQTQTVGAPAVTSAVGTSVTQPLQRTVYVAERVPAPALPQPTITAPTQIVRAAPATSMGPVATSVVPNTASYSVVTAPTSGNIAVGTATYPTTRMVSAASNSFNLGSLTQEYLRILQSGQGIMLPDMLFEGSSTRLPDEAALALQAAASAMKTVGGNFVVNGFASAEGDPQTNLALSWSRARVAGNQLAKLGINQNSLYVLGHGGTTMFGPIAKNNRRVTIAPYPN